MRISGFLRERFDVRTMHQHFAFAFSIVTANEVGGIAHLFEHNRWFKGRAKLLIFHAPVIAFNQALISDAVESITDLLFFVEGIVSATATLRNRARGAAVVVLLRIKDS